MAVTAREVIMTFRGQNYLSGAIRRVGRDVGSLSRTQQVAAQRASLQTATQRLRITRAQAYLDERSYREGGKRQKELAKAFDSQRIASQRATATQIEATTKLAQMQRIMSKQGTLKGFTKAESEEMIKAQRIRAQAATDAVAIQAQAQDVLNARQMRNAQQESLSGARRREATRELEQMALREQRLAMEEQRLDRLRTWQSRARNIEHAGRALQMFGLIASAALGYAATQAANLNTQITLAATQARKPGASFTTVPRIASRVQNQVFGLMRQLPFQGQDIADAFYQVFSGTNIQNVGRATELVRTFGQAAVAGGTDLKTMVDAGLTMHNVFGKEFANDTDAANAFFAAVRFGRMNVEQFAHALPSVASIAKQVGLHFYDIAGAIAALTRATGGRLTSRDTTGLARMIEVFSKPEFIAGAKKMGVNIKDAAGNMRPLPEVLTELSKATKGKGGIDLINLFKTVSALGSASGRGGTAGTIQARRVFAFLLNNMNEYLRVSQLVQQDNNEMVESFKAMRETKGIQWQIFTNQLRVLVYEVGIKAIPVFIQFGQYLGRAVNWFNNLSPGAQGFIVKLVTITSLLSLLVGSIGAVGAGFASFIMSLKIISQMKFIQGIAGGRTAGTLGIGALASEAGFTTPQTAAISAAIVLLVTFHKQVNSVVQALGGWYQMMQMLTGLFAAWKMTALIGGFSAFVTEVNIASTAVLGLQTRLLALGKIAPIIGAALLSMIPQAAKNPNPSAPSNNPVAQFFSALPIVGGAFSQAGRLADWFDKKVGLIGDWQIPSGPAGTGGPIGSGLFNALRRGFNVKMPHDKSAALRAAVDPATHQIRTINQWVRALYDARKAMLGDPTDRHKALVYEKLQRDLNTVFKGRPALLAAINDQLDAYNQNMDQATKQTVTYSDVFSGLQQMYENFKQQETNLMGTIFQGPFVNNPLTQNRLRFGGRLSFMDLLRDRRSQLSQFNKFHGELRTLRRRGAPEELITELMQAGPQAMPMIQQLIKASPQQLREYFRVSNKIQQAITQQTQRDLQNQINIYRKHGENIAKAIIAGIQSQDQAMTHWLKRFIKTVFPGLPTTTQTTTPPPTKTPPPRDSKKPPNSTSEKNTHRHNEMRTRQAHMGTYQGSR